MRGRYLSQELDTDDDAALIGQVSSRLDTRGLEPGPWSLVVESGDVAVYERAFELVSPDGRGD